MWKELLILSLGAFQCTGMTALHNHYFIITITCIFNVVSCITVLFRVVFTLFKSRRCNFSYIMYKTCFL